VTRILEAPSCDFRNFWNFVKLSAWLSHISLLFVGTWTFDSNSRNPSSWDQIEKQVQNHVSDCFASISPVPVPIVLLWLRQLAGCQEKHWRFSPQIFFLLAAAMQANRVAKPGKGVAWIWFLATIFPYNCLNIGKMLVLLGWYPSCLSPQGALEKGDMIYPMNTY